MSWRNKYLLRGIIKIAAFVGFVSSETFGYPTSDRCGDVRAPESSQKAVQANAPLYLANCGGCHGEALEGTQFGPTLKGANFVGKWSSRPSSELFKKISKTMPPGQAGTLDSASYHAITQYLVDQNGGLASNGSPLSNAAHSRDKKILIEDTGED